MKDPKGTSRRNAILDVHPSQANPLFILAVHHSATHPKYKGTMDQQMHELTLLSLLAVLGTVLASMREDHLFTAVFAAEAGFAFASLVRRLI